MEGQLLFRKKKKNFLKILIFIILFILFIYIFFFQVIYSIFLNTPLFQNILLNFENKQKLMESNKELTQRLALLETTEQQIFFYQKKKKQLQSQLNFQNLTNQNKKTYNIISKFNNIFFDKFFVRDKNNKIKKGDLVFARYNLLIGEVDFRKKELVGFSLFSSANKRTPMFLYDGGKPILRVEVVGQGGGILKVLAPRKIEFENTDNVFLAHQDNSLFLIARKIDSYFKHQDTNETLIFQMMVNPNLLNKVQILQTKNENN